MRRLAVVGVGVTLVVLGACGGKDEPLVPTATVPQATTTTDPYAVPEVIDEAYVNRVLAGLDHAVGEVVRLVVSSRTIPPEALDRLRAMYLGDVLQLQIDGFQRDMFNGFADYRQNPEDQITKVVSLLNVTTSCIFAKVTIDFSAVGRDPDPALSTQWVALVPIEQDRDPMGHNPTPWVFIYEGFRRDLSQPTDPCAGY